MDEVLVLGTLSGYVPTLNTPEYAGPVRSFDDTTPEGIKSPMNIFKNLAVIGPVAALLFACSSKEKDADVAIAVPEDVASADVDEPDTESSKTAGITGAADAGVVGESPEELKARRAEARRNKAGEAGHNLRDRRAERLAQHDGDDNAFDPKATGPRAIKPGGTFSKPTSRPAAMQAVGAADVVAVAIDESPAGETPIKAEAGAVATSPADKAPVDIAPLAVGNAQGEALQLDRIMPLAVASEILGKGNLRDKGMLPGIAAAGGYSSVYYDINSKDYGVALQIWRDLTPRETEDRFRRVRLQHPNADDVQSLKPLKAFYAGYFGIQSLTFARPDKMLVVTLSCGEELCDHAALLKLAQAAQNRL